MEKKIAVCVDITRIFSVSSSFSNKNIYDNLIEMQILRACKSGPAGKWCVLEQRKRFVKYLSFILTYHGCKRSCVRDVTVTPNHTSLLTYNSYFIKLLSYSNC